MNSPAALHEDDFYFRALQRIRGIMIVLAAAGVITACAYLGWRSAVGLVLGSVIGFLNFYWLEKVVSGIGELTVRSGAPVSTSGIVTRFLLRYFLMAAVAFVILVVSRESLYGLFAGLLLPVAAMLCEAGYEAYKVIRGSAQ